MSLLVEGNPRSPQNRFYAVGKVTRLQISVSANSYSGALLEGSVCDLEVFLRGKSSGNVLRSRAVPLSSKSSKFAIRSYTSWYDKPSVSLCFFTQSRCFFNKPILVPISCLK